MRTLRFLAELFRRGKDKFTYGIYTACRRCSYAKSHEQILIFSASRGPRIIMCRPSGAVYVRHQECLGFKECGRCFEAVTNGNLDVPCLWAKL